MDKSASLLDKSIEYSITFPRTVIGLLFSPIALFDSKQEENLCPPGVTFIISLTLWFLASHLLLRIESGNPKVPLTASADNILWIIVGTAIVLVAQANSFALILRGRWSAKASAHLLVYPIAACFFWAGAVQLLGIYFPTVPAAADNLYMKYMVCDDKMDPAVFPLLTSYCSGTATQSIYMQSRNLEKILAVVIYPWCLFNVLRANLKVALTKTVGLSVFGSVVLMLLTLTAFGMVSLTSERVERLTADTKQLHMQSQKISPTSPASAADGG